MQVRELAQTAREASRVLAVVSGEVRKQALETIAQGLEANELKILAANARDMEAGKELVEKGELEMPLLKRLDLSGRKFAGMGERVRSVASPPDPLGQTERSLESE